MKMACARCATVLELPEKVGFSDTCASCDSWLHSCVNCTFWIKGQCTEPSAEKERDPEGINYCDWYRGIEINSADEREGQTGREEAEELWRKFTKSRKEE